MGVSLTLCQKILNTAGNIFYQVVRTWRGVIMTIRKFFKAKNSVNTEHQLKSNLAWSVFQKKFEIKTKMVQEQQLQLKMTFLFFYWVELTFGNENLVGTRRTIKFLAGWGTPRIHIYIYIYIFIYIYLYIHIYIIHVIHIHI